jgi:uncharacterized repeat protein (TIGR01451 family)
VTIHVPDLELVKTTGAAGFPDSAPAETETAFPWRIVVTNPNAGSSLLGVDVTDVLPDNWSYVPNSAQVTGTGTLTPGGQVEPAISGQELRWQNVADLTGAQTVVIEFEAIPEPAAALDPGVGVPHVNDADAVGEDTSGAQGSADGPYADEDPAEAVLAAPAIDLAITKTADDPVAVAGTQTSWTMVVTNNGPKTAPEATVTDTIPAGLTYVSATPDQGTCQYSPVTLDCELGELANGDQVEIELVTEVDPSFAGQTITNEATVSDPAGDDTDPTNDTDEDSIVPAASADVGITKRLEGELLVGRTATYVLDVTNHGASDAAAVTVTDELPASLAVESVDGPNCSVSGQRVDCALGTLKPGESRTIRIIARVNAVDAAGVVNTATVDTTTPDPKPENNTASTTNTPGNADLAIAKKGPDKLEPGKEFSYLLTVTNVGTVASGGTATVVDTLPGALKPLSAAGQGWSCAIAKQTVTCERSDALAPGAEFPQIKVRAELSDDTKANKVKNVATVSLPADANPANDSDSHTGEVDAGDLRGEGGGGEEVSCTGAKLSAVPEMVFVGDEVKLKLFLEARSGRPIKGAKVKLRHNPGGETDADRTNRRGIAAFDVKAESTQDRWIAKAKQCRAKERIDAEPSPVCRAETGDPGSDDEQLEAVDPRSGDEPEATGAPSRRC